MLLPVANHNLTLWLRADPEWMKLGPNNEVLEWKDIWDGVTFLPQPTNTTVTPNYLPPVLEFSSLAGRPAVKFLSPINDALYSPGIYGVHQTRYFYENFPRTIFMVLNTTTLSHQQEIFSAFYGTMQSLRIDPDGKLAIRNTEASISQPGLVNVHELVVYTFVNTHTELFFYINGNLVYNDTGFPVWPMYNGACWSEVGCSVSIGGTFAGRDFEGHIAEFLLYWGALSDYQRVQVEQYLLAYYSDNPPQAPDPPPRPTTSTTTTDTTSTSTSTNSLSTTPQTNSNTGMDWESDAKDNYYESLLSLFLSIVAYLVFFQIFI